MGALEYEFRPLGIWSGPQTPRSTRKRSQFKVSYDATLDQLFHEAELLGAKHLVLQVDLQARDIRVDGLPKANARYGTNPGVVVSFESKHGPLRYATDTYDDWRSNLRAIALSLESLRAVDRHGVSSHGEQYRGWTAIAAATPGRGPFAAKAEAETWMRKCAAESGITTWRDWDGLYRMLARRMHPDTTGSRELWDRLDAAATLIGVRKNGGAGA